MVINEERMNYMDEIKRESGESLSKNRNDVNQVGRTKMINNAN